MFTRLAILCLVALPLVGPRLAALAEEPVPVFVANVDATPLAGNPHPSLASLTIAPNSFLAQLGKQIRERVKNSQRIKLVEDAISAPIEGMLVLVVSLGHAEVVRWGTDLEGGRKLTEVRLRLSGELQLIEPVSGQVIYADADYFLGEEWDEQGRHYLARDFNPKKSIRFKEDPTDSSTLHKYVDGKSTGSIGRQEAFQGLMERGVEKLMRDLQARFTPRRVKGQVAQILSPARGEFILNQGRVAGLFPGMRLVSTADQRVAIVTDSFADYALVRTERAPAPAKWEMFTAYQVALGSPTAQALTTVTRILFSETLLKHPEAGFLDADERQLERSLNSTNEQSVAIFQAVFAKHLTDQLVDGGKLRLGFPVSGKASLSRARVNLSDKFTWSTNLYESSVLPDYGVTALISNLAKSRRRITGGHEDRYEVTVSLSLYNFRNGEILCSASSRGERTVREAEHGDLKALINESRAAEVFNLIRGTLKLAAEKLPARIRSENVVGRVAAVAGNTLQLDFPPGTSLHAGQVLQLAGLEGEIQLTQQGKTKTEFHRPLAGWPMRLERQDHGHWQAVRGDAGPTSSGSPKIGDKLFLYGLPSRTGVAPFPQLIRVHNAAIGSSAEMVITPEDLRQLTFSVANDEPRLRLLFGAPARAQLRRFDKIKFLAKNAYTLPEDLDVEAGKFAADLASNLLANVRVDNAQVRKLSEDPVKKTKEVQLDFKVTFGLYDRDGHEQFKPATFTLNKTQTMKLDEPDGDPAARLYLSDILTKLVAFYCEKRLPALQ